MPENELEIIFNLNIREALYLRGLILAKLEKDYSDFLVALDVKMWEAINGDRTELLDEVTP